LVPVVGSHKLSAVRVLDFRFSIGAMMQTALPLSISSPTRPCAGASVAGASWVGVDPVTLACLRKSQMHMDNFEGGRLLRGVAAALVTSAVLRESRSRTRRSAVPQTKDDAKQDFLSLLEKRGRDCTDKEVIAAVESLATLSPTKDPATTGAFLDADWRQVSKSTFPGEIRDEVYTLGRLSFGLYEPLDMEWQIDKTLNPVRPASDSKDGERDYEFWIQLTCVDSRYPKFRGLMKNFGKCKPHPKDSSRLEVWFTGGSFAPAEDMDKALLPEWKKTFGAAIGAKKPSLFNRLTNWAMKQMMGLERPGSVADDGSMRYEMTKAPHGYTDILFMDEELRITKGNRGSIVVVDRDPIMR